MAANSTNGGMQTVLLQNWYITLILVIILRQPFTLLADKLRKAILQRDGCHMLPLGSHMLDQRQTDCQSTTNQGCTINELDPMFDMFNAQFSHSSMVESFNFTFLNDLPQWETQAFPAFS